MRDSQASGAVVAIRWKKLWNFLCHELPTLVKLIEHLMFIPAENPV